MAVNNAPVNMIAPSSNPGDFDENLSTHSEGSNTMCL